MKPFRRISQNPHKNNTSTGVNNAPGFIDPTDSHTFSNSPNSILRFLITILLTGLVVLFISTEFYQLNFIAGDSMAPTLSNKQPVLVQKWGIPDHIERDDILVIKVPAVKQTIVKRVVGMPGDTIQIKDGLVYINGSRHTEVTDVPAILDSGNAAKPITLNEDEYFVLGDNRNASIDSRFDEIGIIPVKNIMGIVVQ